MALQARTAWCPSTTAQPTHGFCPHITGPQFNVLDQFMGEQMNNGKGATRAVELALGGVFSVQGSTELQNGLFWDPPRTRSQREKRPVKYVCAVIRMI